METDVDLGALLDPFDQGSVDSTLACPDGKEQSEHLSGTAAAPGRPMSDAELDIKARELAAYGAPFCRRCRADRGGAGHRRRDRSDLIDAPDRARMTGLNQPARAFADGNHDRSGC
jgi:hypothetical protein